VADHGLRNAVSLQGGRDYVVNSRLAAAKPLRLRISYGANLEMKRKDISVLVDEVVYEFAVKFDKKGLGFTILEDSLTSHLKFSRPAGKKKPAVEGPSERGRASSSTGKAESITGWSFRPRSPSHRKTLSLSS